MKAVRRMMLDQEGDAKEDDVLLLTEPAGPAVRDLGRINWRGMATLGAKEIQRFMKIPGQTVFSPLMMTLLFYSVFALGMNKHPGIGGVPFLNFIIPGLIMMSMAQSAFMNTAASLILSKLQENIVDVLMAPLSAFELTVGYVVGGVARGLLVGLAALAVMSFFVAMPVHNVFVVIYYAVMGTLMLSLAGLMTGIWGDKFDHLGAIQNFIIMPATFLSGTFFAVKDLPEKWHFICFMNPFFYMIDGFRYGFTGYADGSLIAGAGIMLIVDLVLAYVAYAMFAMGTYLKK